MDLKETPILGDDISKHWYYLSKANAVRRILKEYPVSNILDVGAGSGFFSRFMLKNTTAEESWCVDISYPSDSNILEAGKPLHFRRAIDFSDADLVLLMDVLEHVDDDVGLLSSYVSRVRRGSRFLISVPAFQCFWTEHDEFLEHKRRYTLPHLEDVVCRAGLTPLGGYYYFGLILPLAMITRLAGRMRVSANENPKSQLKKHSAPVNAFLSVVCNAELPLLAINRLAGLTAFCIAESR